MPEPAVPSADDGSAAIRPGTGPSPQTDAPTVVMPATVVPSVDRAAPDAPTTIIPALAIDTPTTLMAPVPQLTPVFVDPTGRRRLRLRLLAFLVGLAGLAYLGMVGVSFAGGPVNPETVLPFVDTTQRPWEPPAPVPIEAVTTPTAGTPSPGEHSAPPARPTSGRKTTSPARDASNTARPTGSATTSAPPKPTVSPSERWGKHKSPLPWPFKSPLGRAAGADG